MARRKRRYPSVEHHRPTRRDPGAGHRAHPEVPRAAEHAWHVELDLERPVADGAVLGHEPDGRVVLTRGGLPGERVRVEVDRAHRDHLEATVIDVLRAAPGRREPPCPHVAEGCGGCDLQHLAVGEQLGLKVQVAADALRRLGRRPDAAVLPGGTVPAEGYRTTARVVVTDGRAAYRRPRSHHPVVIDSCPVAHPGLAELLVEGRFGDADEVTLRVSAGTGERLVVASPTAAGVSVPDDVVVVGESELAAGRPVALHELVGGRRYRLSAGAFFQSSAAGAELLAAEVSRAVQDGADGSGGGRLVDAFGGVGVLAGEVLARTAGPWSVVTVIEWNRAACADARANLGDDGVTVLERGVDRWSPTPADVVIADPARAGLGRSAAERLAGAGARRLILVSCDAAALGRDTALLGASGYRHVQSVVLDLFPQTHHLEVVTTFVRS